MAFGRVQFMVPSMPCYISSLNITNGSQALYVKQIVSCLLVVFTSVPFSRECGNTPAIPKLSYGYLSLEAVASAEHDNVIKWKRFPRYWPFVRGIHRLPVNSPRKDLSFDLRLNKWLSKQSWGWWFETLSCSLWRHRSETRALDSKQLIVFRI